MGGARVGALLAEWRHRRRVSQLAVASDVGVSTRHLSYVETGRSRPSPELILTLSEHLDVPLRDRNVMLLAAGYAPRYSQSSLEDPSMQVVRGSLQRMLDAHHPYPGVVIDRSWNVVLSNAAALALLDGVAEHVLQPRINVFRVCLHPEGLASRTANFTDWSQYLLGQIRRTIRLTGDDELQALEQELLAMPSVADVDPRRREPSEVDGDPPLLVPFELDTADGRWSLFTTLTTFGTPLDVTLEELSVELFFPADVQTEARMRRGWVDVAMSDSSTT